MTLLFDTARLPTRDRVDALQSAFTVESPQRVDFIGGEPVHHRIDVVELGPAVRLRRNIGSPLQVTRSARHVRVHAPEVLALGVVQQGEGALETGSGPARYAVGHLSCTDTTRPYRLTQSGTGRHDVLMVGLAEIGLPVDTVRAAAPALAGSPVYDLVRGHLAGLFDATDGLAVPARRLAGQATLLLVRALLLTAVGQRAGRDALADSLEVHVRAYVDAHLGDRDLTVESLAAAHHVSVRHLYHVWARAGHEQTPAQWITERRLDRARQHLITAPDTSVAAVAHRWGFADASHFGRRFRAAFGQSPAAWRRDPGPDSVG